MLIAIFCLVSLALVSSILFFPNVKIFNLKFSSYWVIALFGTILVVLFNFVDFNAIFSALTADSAVNPLKILVIFISMTVLSVFLDEVGFFEYLASVVIKKAKNSQFKIFLIIYLTVSVLTVFTSNDVVVLTFTPFICYFCKSAKINPLPYLIAEFVASNTWSMLLIIGNPTNIYLATSFNITFLEYLSVMFIPTIFGGIVNFLAVFLIFKKQLSKPIEKTQVNVVIKDKFLLILGVSFLGLCIFLLALSSYIGFEMWLICLSCALLLLITASSEILVTHHKLSVIKNTLKRAPYQLIPFVLCMFILVLALDLNGFTTSLRSFLDNVTPSISYGFSSLIFSNLINNIPMSILFQSVLSSGQTPSLIAVYASIIGSNIGAYLTPVGALAGIMWAKILKQNGIAIKFYQFVLYGVMIAIPTLIFSLIGLELAFLIF